MEVFAIHGLHGLMGLKVSDGDFGMDGKGDLRRVWRWDHGVIGFDF